MRSKFSRLYFVSDEDLIEALSSTQSVSHLLPVTRRCFPGIVNIAFELPNSHSQSFNTRWSSAVNCMVIRCYSELRKRPLTYFCNAIIIVVIFKVYTVVDGDFALLSEYLTLKF